MHSLTGAGKRTTWRGDEEEVTVQGNRRGKNENQLWRKMPQEKHVNLRF